MGIKLDPQYLKRYKEIAGLLMNYGNSDLVKNAGLEEALKDDENLSRKVKETAEELAADLERLGPAYVKLGQILLRTWQWKSASRNLNLMNCHFDTRFPNLCKLTWKQTLLK